MISLHEKNAHFSKSDPMLDVGSAGEKAVMKAWEDYLTGAAEKPRVRDVIAQSWQRCTASGIDHKWAGSRIIVEENEFQQRLKRNGMLLNAADDVMAEVRHLFAGGASMLLLTDVDGVILCAAGDPAVVHAGEEINLVVAADWSERNAGTNGIGTTLASHDPVLIHGAEHFCSLSKNWTCAGSPVRNPRTGEILGLVDVSGRKAAFHQNDLAFAVMAARRIEMVLKLQLEHEHSKLLEYSYKVARGSANDGIVVVDRYGRILSASDQASRLLAMRAGASDLLDESFRADKPLLQRTRDGSKFDLSTSAALGIDAGNVICVHHEGELIGAIVIASTPTRTAGASVKRTKAFAPIVTSCAMMFDTIHRSSRLAAYHAPVLIEGETGVGKELFARAIHDASPCAEGPFVAFNCGAISRDLIATELFGYVKGAFTGASSSGNLGRFERANNGTLCLDEIGELPLDLQPFLLRVLEEGTVYRVGDATPRHVKVRLIAMTNRDLTEEVEKGRFRRDLLYRLNVSTLRVPPLRKRQGDAALLAQHFLDVLSKKHELGVRHFSPDVLELFKTYPWPGNIRELRNAVESALLLCDAPVIGRGWLPDAMLDYTSSKAQPSPVLQAVCSPAERYRQPGNMDRSRQSDLRTLDKEHIENVLERFKGNISLSAAALGIARSTLYCRLQAYGMDIERKSL